MFIKKSCEDSNTAYLCLFGRRLIFCKEGRLWRYRGWYNPNLKTVV